MPRLVQFMHPGGQPAYRGPGIKPWNDGNHCRLFLMASGSFCRLLSKPAERADRLLFWGEWEACAKAINLGTNPAHAVFVPIFPTFPNRAGLQNTDPFVFDGPFLYSCCRQFKNGFKNYLRDLERGDVLLFGSHLNGQFVLDTVFVVADGQLYDKRIGAKQLSSMVPQSFVEATLKPLAYAGKRNAASCQFVKCTTAEWVEEDELALCGHPAMSKRGKYRLYRGATPDNPVDGMFSFAPAKVAGEAIAAFERPSLKNFVKPKMTTGFRDCLKGRGTARAVSDAWGRIADVVLAAGLVLGTRFQISQRSR